MAKIQKSSMDTPWHVGYVKKEDDDPRRHRAKCTFYDNKTKICNNIRSPYDSISCGYVSHCTFYVQKSLVEENETSKSDTELTQNNKTVITKNFIVNYKETVEIGDYVTFKNVATQREHYYYMGDIKGRKIPEINRLCMGQQLGYVFDCKGTIYKITIICQIKNR